MEMYGAAAEVDDRVKAAVAGRERLSGSGCTAAHTAGMCRGCSAGGLSRLNNGYGYLWINLRVTPLASSVFAEVKKTRVARRGAFLSRFARRLLLIVRPSRLRSLPPHSQ